MSSPSDAQRATRWRVIAFAAAISIVLLGFLLCYGSAVPLLFWAASCIAIAFVLRRRWKRFSISLLVLGVGGLLLWPVDASRRFPVLRLLQSTRPFGPEIAAYPSPSGRCVAYVYNLGFIDSAYGVRFAHGLAFPGDLHWVPLGGLSDVKGIEPRWNAGIFSVDVFGPGVTLIYDEDARTITLPKGPM